jgi:outer membrane protein TolC
MSIEGSAPSVVQVQAIRSLWDPSKNWRTAQVREDARAATHAVAAVREEALWRVAQLHLDLVRLDRSLQFLQAQVQTLLEVERITRLRLEEGRETETGGLRARVDLARARQRLRALESARDSAARALALALALDPADTLRPAAEDRSHLPLPASAEELRALALQNSAGLRRLESSLMARQLEVKSHRATRLPKIDLVAQYGLFAKFNNYEEYFRRFQRHNGQVGASVQIPIFADQAAEARAAQAEIEQRRLRAQIQDLRARLNSSALQSWQQVRDAADALDLARLDLDLARQQVSDALAQSAEGRLGLRELEQARFQENERWLQFYDARHQSERARLELLQFAGRLSASLQ